MNSARKECYFLYSSATRKSGVYRASSGHVRANQTLMYFQKLSRMCLSAWSKASIYIYGPRFTATASNEYVVPLHPVPV